MAVVRFRRSTIPNVLRSQGTCVVLLSLFKNLGEIIANILVLNIFEVTKARHFNIIDLCTIFL